MSKEQKTIHVVLNARGNGRRTYEHDGDVMPIQISNEDYEFLKKNTGRYDTETIDKSGNILNNGLARTGIVDTDTYYVGALFKKELV